MIDCPVCPKTDIKEGITKCPQCGTDLSALLRVRELPDIYYNEGVELAKNGLLDEAIGKLILSLEINPNSIAPHVVIGKILAKMGRYDEAVGHLDKALSIDPDNTGASIEKRRIDDTIENGQHSQNDLEEIGSLVTAIGAAFCIGGAICAIVTQQTIQTASGTIAMAGMGFFSDAHWDKYEKHAFAFVCGTGICTGIDSRDALLYSLSDGMVLSISRLCGFVIRCGYFNTDWKFLHQNICFTAFVKSPLHPRQKSSRAHAQTGV